MKIFSQHCELLQYSVTTPSKVAVQLHPDVVGDWTDWKNCLFLLAGIETDDVAKVPKAVKAIKRIGHMTNAEQIVINGFSGFANPGTNAEESSARAILADIEGRLTSNGWATHVMPFGWNKRWRLTVYDGVWAQRVTHV